MILNKLAFLFGLGFLSSPISAPPPKGKSNYVKKDKPKAGAKMRRKALEHKLTKRWA